MSRTKVKRIDVYVNRAMAARVSGPDPIFDPSRMFRAMERYGHSAALGFHFAGTGDDWAELTMDWRPDLVGDVEAKTFANGAVIALIDMTAGMAVWVKLGHFRPQVTLDLRTDYLRAAAPGAALTARVHCYRVASEVAFVRGIAHDGDADDPVANMTATFMFTGPPMAERGTADNPVDRFFPPTGLPTPAP